MALAMGPDGELTTTALLAAAEEWGRQADQVAELDAKYRERQYRRDAAFDELLAACKEWVAYLDPINSRYNAEETSLISQMQSAITNAEASI